MNLREIFFAFFLKYKDKNIIKVSTRLLCHDPLPPHPQNSRNNHVEIFFRAVKQCGSTGQASTPVDRLVGSTTLHADWLVTFVVEFVIVTHAVATLRALYKGL